MSNPGDPKGHDDPTARVADAFESLGLQYVFDAAGNVFHADVDGAPPVDIHVTFRQGNHDYDRGLGVVILAPIRLQLPLTFTEAFEWAVVSGQQSMHGRINIWRDSGLLDIVYSVALDTGSASTADIARALGIAIGRCRELRSQFDEEFPQMAASISREPVERADDPGPEILRSLAERIPDCDLDLAHRSLSVEVSGVPVLIEADTPDDGRVRLALSFPVLQLLQRPSPQHRVVLSIEGAFRGLSALVVDGEVLRAGLSLSASRDDVAFAVALLTHAAYTEPAKTLDRARVFAGLVGGAPLVPVPQATLGLGELSGPSPSNVAPEGSDRDALASRCRAEATTALADAEIEARTDGDALVASLRREGPMIESIDASDRSGDLDLRIWVDRADGRGGDADTICWRLALPYFPRDDQWSQIYPIDLNGIEWRFERGTLLGSWATTPTAVEAAPYFALDLPLPLMAPGMPAQITNTMVARARWVMRRLAETRALDEMFGTIRTLPAE